MAFEPDSLGQRITFCRAVLLVEDVRYPGGNGPTQSQFGFALARKLRRDQDFPAATISRWESDIARPSLTVIQAIGQLVGADPGWLAFGSASAAPNPLARMPERVRKYAEAFGELAKMEAVTRRRVAEIRRESRERASKMRKAMPRPAKRGNK